MSEQNPTPRPEGEEPTNADGPETDEQTVDTSTPDTGQRPGSRLAVPGLERFGAASITPKNPRTPGFRPNPDSLPLSTLLRQIGRNLARRPMKQKEQEDWAKRTRDVIKGEGAAGEGPKPPKDDGDAEDAE